MKHRKGVARNMAKKTSSVKKATKSPKSASPAPAPVTLGTKRQCSHCHAKFYDFGKTEIICPKCERVVNPNAVPSFRRSPEPKRPSSRDPFDDEADVVIESSGASDDEIDSEVTGEIEIENDD